MNHFQSSSPPALGVSGLGYVGLPLALEFARAGCRALNIALVNELKLISERMGINIWELIEAAATKPLALVPCLWSFPPLCRVGDWAVVGAGSVVIEDVPPGTTVVGNPTHVVKRESAQT